MNDDDWQQTKYRQYLLKYFGNLEDFEFTRCLLCIYIKAQNIIL